MPVQKMSGNLLKAPRIYILKKKNDFSGKEKRKKERTSHSMDFVGKKEKRENREKVFN